jgi:hypothetical protein
VLEERSEAEEDEEPNEDECASRWPRTTETRPDCRFTSSVGRGLVFHRGAVPIVPAPVALDQGHRAAEPAGAGVLVGSNGSRVDPHAGIEAGLVVVVVVVVVVLALACFGAVVDVALTVCAGGSEFARGWTAAGPPHPAANSPAAMSPRRVQRRAAERDLSEWFASQRVDISPPAT